MNTHFFFLRIQRLLSDRSVSDEVWQCDQLGPSCMLVRANALDDDGEAFESE